jgi:hypothetical protein
MSMLQHISKILIELIFLHWIKFKWEDKCGLNYVKYQKQTQATQNISHLLTTNICPDYLFVTTTG